MSNTIQAHSLLLIRAEMISKHKLKEFASCIELYATRHRMLMRLDMEDYDTARVLCRQAIKYCEARIWSEALQSDRDRHKHNLECLQLLEQGIEHAAQSERRELVESTGY